MQFRFCGTVAHVPPRAGRRADPARASLRTRLHGDASSTETAFTPGAAPPRCIIHLDPSTV